MVRKNKTAIKMLRNTSRPTARAVSAGKWACSAYRRAALLRAASGKLKARTLDEYAKLFDRYVSPELGHLPIAAITP